ncbi:MAG: thioredoxin family protein [Candidatus Muirbacterium halophilum]|nr:thioredoxin family protein [Candidatus Muirbacterium halophilum]MCK9474318.1 thioredoxin family protein [Candidatus Muirbacterium halophilum]
MKGYSIKKIIFFFLIIIALGIILQKSYYKTNENIEFNDFMSEVNEDNKKEIPITRPNKKRLPKLIDIGSGTCVPCKMMKPIIEDFQKNYNEYFETVYIDLNIAENREKAIYYDVRVIPTIIFFDEEGKQLYRHEGYISKEDILKTWDKYNIKVN